MSVVQAEPTLAEHYAAIRSFTDRLTAPLSPEDCMVQSMEEASPVRWHLAHTTWFFETFVLAQDPGYRRFDEAFHYLFNSYYNTLGQQFPRGHRGLISRPGLQRIRDYRQYVDQHMWERLHDADDSQELAGLVAVGLNHEQQHQELILTDIKHVLSCNPTWPAYQELPLDTTCCSAAADPETISVDGGIYEVGHQGDGFAFDNESPRHQVLLPGCRIDRRLVTCGEYLQFMLDGGYQRPEHWLSAGWATVNQQGWQAPLYWVHRDDQWWQFTLAGLLPVDLRAPVSHVSFFEADAYARWRGKRLPTEFEWEVAAAQTPLAEDEPLVDTLVERNLAIHPTRSPSSMCGAVWQWTSSNYLGYPGYRPPAGAVGEYNGKFMCDQHVLRGGSVATHRSHLRTTYRNFFHATARWQFSGIRLAS